MITVPDNGLAPLGAKNGTIRCQEIWQHRDDQVCVPYMDQH